jgi:hypothetical protein
VPLGDIAVGDGVLRLDRGDDAEPREPGQVLGADQLGMLDPAATTHLLEGVQRRGIGPVADGVDGWVQAGRPGPAHQVHQILNPDQAQAVGAGALGQAGVRIEAPRRTGVERSVAHDLERADVHAPSGSVHDVARTTAGRDGRIQPRAPDAGVHPHRWGTVRLRPASPGFEVVAELQVGQSRDAQRRQARHGLGDPGVELCPRNGPADPGLGPHGVGLAQHAGRVVGHADQGEGGAVEPGRVQVDAADRDGGLADDVVEVALVGLHVPHGVDDPAAPEHLAVSLRFPLEMGPQPVGGLDWSGRRGEVDALQVPRPFLDVHVAVDQTGQHRRVGERHDLGAARALERARRPDLCHHAVGDEDVSCPATESEPTAAQQHRTFPDHGSRLGAGSVVPTVVTTRSPRPALSVPTGRARA